MHGRGETQHHEVPDRAWTPSGVRRHLVVGLGTASHRRCFGIPVRLPAQHCGPARAEGEVMATCNGCKTAADESRSIRLPGGWSLNHYGGDEGFFGWLALQPIEHRLTLRDLSEVEAAALGPNLGRLEQGIYGYWQSAGQPADRVYAMYFLESQLESGHSWHLHIHVVPRFRCLAELMPLSD